MSTSDLLNVTAAAAAVDYATIATILVTIAAAAIVLRNSQFHVSLTQRLGLDTGSQHFALQKAVAVKVSCGN